ncbi:MAG: carbohydrate ABC transporter permease [Anaerolineae bacterium]|nr:carbohydrate ABC transporter permease [Anaerolineae bacterium]
MNTNKLILRLGLGAILSLALVFFLFPVLWMFLTSFKTQDQIFASPPVLIPPQDQWNLVNYLGALNESGGLQAVRDSLIVAAATALVSVGVGALAAYSLARYRTGGQQFAFWILSTRMFPPVASAIPLFLIFRELKLLDTYWALILANTIFNLPFAIWLLKGFIEELPYELEESALIDGASTFGAFWRVTLPLIRPGIVTALLFTFVFTWNEFMFALLMTRRNVRPLTVMIQSLAGGHEILWAQIAAAGVIAIIPGILLVIFLQRHIVRGLTMGALKN